MMFVFFFNRVLELLPKIKVPSNSTSFLDTLLIYLNFIIQKFTYDKYQYHARYDMFFGR